MPKENKEEKKTEESETCEVCGSRKASFSVFQQKGRIQEETKICSVCATKLKIQQESKRLPLAVGDLFAQVLDPEGTSTRDKQHCPRCGTAFEELRLSGRLGCAECFSFFQRDIEQLLPRLSSRPTHEGSVPKRLHAIKRIMVEKPHLKDRLEIALAAEDYEAAAQLRDAIHVIDEEGLA